MNRTTMMIVSCWATILFTLSGTTRAQDTLVGERVISKLNIEQASDARLRVGRNYVGRIEAVNWPITVEHEDGEWTWVDDGVSRGWVRSRYLQTLEQGLAEANAALKRSPQARVYEYRGIIWDAKGEHEQAIKDYTEVIRLLGRRRNVSREDRGVPYYNRGESYLKLGNYDAAIENITRAISFGGSRDILAVFYQKRGEAWSKKNDTARADADFRRSRELKTR